jgi:putative transposase
VAKKSTWTIIGKRKMELSNPRQGLCLHEPQQRNSFMELGEIYFWTATINDWQTLLSSTQCVEVILSSLRFLTDSKKVDVFAFVIMPNHIHLIWRLNAMNGKESSQGSFLKYTAHEFKKIVMNEGSEKLESYSIKAANKDYEFWQRDPLAIQLFTREVAYQKLDYIHNNPISGKWQLVNDPCYYQYSSARFYEKGIKDFEFLKDLREEF